MNNLTSKEKLILKLLYHVFIVLAVVALIVWMLPREKKFNYEFSMGNPWRYGLLTAEFDFPIYKDSHKLQQEQDSVMRDYSPYFTLDESVASHYVEAFDDSCSTSLSKIIRGAGRKERITGRLDAVYAQGIISLEEYEWLLRDSISSVYIVKGNIASRVNTADLLTEKRAYSEVVANNDSTFPARTARQCNINTFIAPNLRIDSVRSQAARDEMLSNVSPAIGKVMKGQKIIDRGEIINQSTYNILKSLEVESQKRYDTNRPIYTMIFGQTAYVLVIVLCFFAYLEIYRRDYLKENRKILLLWGALVVSSLLTCFITKNYSGEYVYAIPYLILPIMVCVFYDSRTAITLNIMNILICSMSVPNQFLFIVLQFIAGFVGVYSLRELSQRSQLFRTSFLIFLAYSITYLGIEAFAEGNFESINYHRYIYFAINCFILLFAYPMMFMIEKIFGFVSNVTLVELSNTNNKLLRELSEIAPGTFQHSMQMSNLAAAAVMKIGGNAQLVRTGALYHDIGKMKNPAFFTENQNGVNPHLQLPYEQSAQIVINHVTDGLKLADKYNLPEAVRRFISTHHGTGRTKYFYISYKNEHPNEPVNEAAFTYPGPNPGTKEEAVLMMADSVEAASRSLKEYTEQSIGTLVDKIIDGQLQEGFFKQCPITFIDIANVKAVFKEKLRIMYHTRISYPELNTAPQHDSKPRPRRKRFFKSLQDSGDAR